MDATSGDTVCDFRALRLWSGGDGAEHVSGGGGGGTAEAPWAQG